MSRLSLRNWRLSSVGWLWAGMLLLALLLVGIRLGYPYYCQSRALADFRHRHLGEVITSPRGPAWFRQLCGREWAEGWSEVRVIVASSRDRFGDPDLAGLAPLTGLQDLDLCGTRITDDGLRFLAGLTQLQRLALEDTEVTDRGLVHLESLTHLGVLTLQGTKVTAAGIAKLQHHLPGTLIVGP